MAASMAFCEAECEKISFSSSSIVAEQRQEQRRRLTSLRTSSSAAAPIALLFFSPLRSRVFRRTAGAGKWTARDTRADCGAPSETIDRTCMYVALAVTMSSLTTAG